jgi:hypothetical protein
MASPCLGGLWLDTVSDRTIEQEAAGRGFAARRRFREAEAAARAVNAEPTCVSTPAVAAAVSAFALPSAAGLLFRLVRAV